MQEMKCFITEFKTSEGVSAHNKYPRENNWFTSVNVVMLVLKLGNCSF